MKVATNSVKTLWSFGGTNCQSHAYLWGLLLRQCIVLFMSCIISSKRALKNQMNWGCMHTCDGKMISIAHNKLCFAIFTWLVLLLRKLGLLVVLMIGILFLFHKKSESYVNKLKITQQTGFNKKGSNHQSSSTLNTLYSCFFDYHVPIQYKHVFFPTKYPNSWCQNKPRAIVRHSGKVAFLLFCRLIGIQQI